MRRPRHRFVRHVLATIGAVVAQLLAATALVYRDQIVRYATHLKGYQRSDVLDDVTDVVSGAAAGTRRTGTPDFTAVSFSWHHFVEIAVFGDHLVLRAVNQNLRVADEAILAVPVDHRPAT